MGFRQLQKLDNDELYHQTKEIINMKSIVQIKDNENVLKELVHIVNYFFEEGDHNDIFPLMIQLSSNLVIRPIGMINLSVYLFKVNLIDLAKKVAKLNIKQTNIHLQAIASLNLARIYFAQLNYAKCLTHAEKALLQYEPYIFAEIKAKTIRNSHNVVILLNGYLFYGKALASLQQQGLRTDEDVNRFYVNGAKLGRRYLGQTHYLTKQFMLHERNSIYIKRNQSQYLQRRNVKVNLRKVSNQVNAFLKSIKIPKQPTSIIRSTSGIQTHRVLSASQNKPQSEKKEQSPRLRIQSPKLSAKIAEADRKQVDIEALIQKKLETFLQTKKNDPRLNELEKKVADLTKENQKVLEQREEREREIEELKQRFSQLSIESAKIRLKLQEQSGMQHSMNIEASPIGQTSQKEPLTFGKMISSMNSVPRQNSNQKGGKFMQNIVGRQSTQDINNLINNLQESTPKEQNSISIINDTDQTVDQNLTFFDQTDHTKFYSIQLSTDVTIVRRTNIDGQVYDIQCSMIQRSKELQMKLQLSSIAFESPNSNTKEKNEFIDTQLLKELIQLIDYHKILPYSNALKTISNFKLFVQYLIFPFVALKDNAISILATPPGLLNDFDKIWLLEHECAVSLHYLDDKNFRLIYQLEGKSCFMDLAFDQSSIDLFFQSCFQEEYEREEVQEMAKLITNEIEKSNDTVKHKHRMYCVQSYIFKDQARFIQLLEKINKDISEILSKLNINSIQDLFKALAGGQITMPNKSQVKIQLCSIKIWQQAQCQRLVIVADNSREQCYEIFLADLFESYGPRNSKVKSEGFTQYAYDQVRTSLSLNPSLLDYSDIILLCSILSRLFTLNTFTKELDLEDYDRFHENQIQEVELQCELYSRQFLTQGYKIPLTMSYLGIQNTPIGIRIQVYDEVSLSEQGIFLTISSQSWEMLKQEVIVANNKKQKAKKYLLSNKMSTEYYLTKILQKNGWQIILDKITIKNTNGRLYACRQLGNNQVTYVDRLENILTLHTLQEYL